DKVIVFTYEADFTKVDGVTKNPLANVEFQLKNADGEFVTVDENGKVTGWATESTDGSKLVSDSKGQFKVIGLDDGTYTLVETKPLDGYNPIEDTTVVISGGTVNNQEWNGEASSALTSFKYTVGNSGEKTGIVDEGIAQGTIENKKGSSLPSAGGIGTTLFYVGGGAMVAVAGVFLITKKRMGKKED
ncbi:MAG: SpaA isopeptide-forming pilin-related protein, partial [Ruminococcus sp.]